MLQNIKLTRIQNRRIGHNLKKKIMNFCDYENDEEYILAMKNCLEKEKFESQKNVNQNFPTFLAC